MINSIIVSGEGATDLGISTTGEGVSLGGDILVGPMLAIIYRLIYMYSPDWFRDLHDWTSDVPIRTYLVSRSERARVSRNLKPNLFQTHTCGRGGIEHTKAAWALAKIAEDKGASLAIYFHDTDGTRSVLQRTPKLREIIESSAEKGFASTPEIIGIPMVPKPTSEAWMICHSKQPAYSYCHVLEQDLSGNKDAPERSPKIILEKLCGNISREVLLDVAGNLDLDRLDMPSFNSFRDKMKLAIHGTFNVR